MNTGKIPFIELSVCVKCHNCIDICPTNAIKAKEDPGVNNYSCAKCVKYCLTMDVPCRPEIIYFLYSLCNSCGKCIDICKYNAIRWMLLQEAGNFPNKTRKIIHENENYNYLRK